MKGVWGKVLKVDLSHGACTTEELPEKVYQYFLGGAGLSAYYLWKESPVGTTTFDPANRLTFAGGPMTGLKQTGAAKWTAGAISPSIHLNADSAATASFGLAIKQAGYDAIVVYGRSPKPVYIVVDNGKVKIKDARKFWGKDAYQAEDGIHEAEGDDYEVVSIGPAGERLVRFACIQTRKKSFLGRSGLGAVMGSKLLKAIAVRGSQECPLHDPAEANRLNKMMGFNTMVDNIQAVAYACELANKYSMDCISLGVIIAWAMESYEKGVLTQKDTYGLDLKWGNAEALVEMTRKIGERADGLGYLLGEGCKVASEKIGQGSEAWAVQMKGQEIAAHNWRAQYISALNYCTGVASGPNHERGNSQHIWVGHVRHPEWGIDEVGNEERWSWDKAADRNAKFHDYCNVINSSCHCKFMEFRGYTLTDLAESINVCTGWGWNTDDLRRCGERITTLQKLLNIRYGWKKEQDFQYPKRFMEPVSEGPAAGKIPVGLEDAIMDYYRVRGWDAEGKPTAELIQKLGMEEYL
jgi:aldehyde:ferredoxin oxidoreductase